MMQIFKTKNNMNSNMNQYLDDEEITIMRFKLQIIETLLYIIFLSGNKRNGHKKRIESLKSMKRE